MDYIIYIVAFAFVLLGLYLRTLVKSTVENSINHQFDIKLKEFEQNFTKELHALDRKDKYQLAALDHRLEVHQIAYALAREMVHTLHSDESKKQIVNKKINEFWDTKCLYLSNKSRSAFWCATISFSDYSMYKESHKHAVQDKDKPYIEETRKNLMDAFRDVTELPKVLQEEVDLDALSSVSVNEVITPDKVEKKRLKK